MTNAFGVKAKGRVNGRGKAYGGEGKGTGLPPLYLTSGYGPDYARHQD